MANGEGGGYCGGVVDGREGLDVRRRPCFGCDNTQRWEWGTHNGVAGLWRGAGRACGVQ
ncbi:DNA-binding protein WhiA [Sesbania bispinosa]|nr:DNA-binding protein WhiA [Sesbania bispinosa]